MEFRDLGDLEKAAGSYRLEVVRIGFALLFFAGIMLYVSIYAKGIEQSYMLVIAAMIGGYMAMNIGANDVANNVGPAVGSKALTMTGAIIIAAVFEAAGALVAGGDVVSTIKNGIIDPSAITDPDTFVWLMMAALLAGALWLNLATFVGAPVSTTHSIVGGVLGAGIAAGGMEVARWNVVGAIAASWVISPLLGGIIAATILFVIKKTVYYQDDMMAAAKKVVPILLAAMAWAFITYLVLKGLKKIWKFDFTGAAFIGLAGAAIVYAIVKPLIKKAALSLSNDQKGVNSLFTVPLIFAAALLSFAHGANDVANAVGPLAAISDSLMTHGISQKAAIPLWVMMVGAIGISLGLMLYGPKLIKTVGSEITELNKTRAFCVAMAAAVTVIIASQLGLPVSSTHIAVGGIFGVGFLREYLKVSYASQLHLIAEQHSNEDKPKIEHFLRGFQKASVHEMDRMLKLVKGKNPEVELTKEEKKRLKHVYKEELVKRSSLLKIAAAWIITVPCSAFLAAFIFFAIRGMMVA
ncbi:MAG: inorganic phosphate transporter [Hahellaceae bacterium]|jgi:PiT family inorganic phosphate transporter|nr:inorganic phosphate transporter [Hahellaceae bacterium]MCP5210750.1 inorganic phosphate transporter [Hahellaceae bacterium]